MSDSLQPSGPTLAPPDLAPHYERIVLDRHLKAGRALVEALAVKAGEHVLELGCSTGLLSEHLADRVGPTGDVLGLDALPMRIQIAHQKVRPNLRFQIGHAQALGRFPRGCFDVICANAVLRGVPDHAAVLAELHRLLRPGGRLGVVEASADHPHPALLVQRGVLAEPPYNAHAAPAEAQEWRLNAAALQAALQAAGFADVLLRSEPDVSVHASANAAIEFVQAGAWGRFLQYLPEPLRRQARAEIVARLDWLRVSDGIHHDGVRLVALASKARD